MLIINLTLIEEKILKILLSITGEMVFKARYFRSSGLLQRFRRKLATFCGLNAAFRPARKSLNAVERTEVVHCEIRLEKMKELLARRQICAADIHCLDEASKRQLQELCLETCLYSASCKRRVR